MLIRMLLKSCATPLASRPIASSFCDWRSCSSSARRSVTSRMKAVTAWRLSDADARDGQFGREHRAVGLHALQLDVLARERAAAPVERYSVERRHPRLAVRFGQQQVHAAAEDVHARAAEHLLGGGIELADVEAAGRS